MPFESQGSEDGGSGPGSDDLLRRVFDAAPSAMLLVAADGRIRMANRHSEQLFGHRREDLAGQPVETLVPERFRGPHPEHRAGFLRAPSVRAMGAGRDLFGLRRDGTEVPIEIGLNPMRVGGELYVLASIIDITQRKRGENLLRASLAEKETLLREIHHRVKNNMQVVSSLLSLQTSNVDEPRYRAMFEECQARVRAMALIHEKLYASGNLAQLEAGEYVRELAQMLVRSYDQGRGRVRLELTAEALPLDIQTAIPVGLLLNELVTNAMKHAFDDDGFGTVHVGLRRIGSAGAELRVADDGRGMAEPQPQTEAIPARGLGLRLVRGLVRQIDGELRRRSDPGRGVEVAIQFPLPASVAGVPTLPPEIEP